MSDRDDADAESSQRDVFWEMWSSAIQSTTNLYTHGQKHPRETFDLMQELAREQTSALLGLNSTMGSDKRFKGKEWSSSPMAKTLCDLWLVYERQTNAWLDKTGTEEDIQHRRRKYMLHFLLSVLSPKNYVTTNPKGLERTRDEFGMNLMRGWMNLLEDVVVRQGLPSQVDGSEFEIGRNIAVSEGAVIHRSEVCELIQYKPRVSQVHTTPILLVWSVINRFYLLDLTERRSLIRNLLDQGFQVYVQSWRNPSEEHSDWTLETLSDATVESIDVVRAVSKCDKINLLAVCAGAYPAYCAVLRKQHAGDPAINAMTTLVSAVDNESRDTLFGLVGTNDTIMLAKARARLQGKFSANELSWALSMLQPERMIFPYFFEGYVLGDRPPASEVAFWLDDQVSISTGFYEQMLDFVTENSFIDPSRNVIGDMPVDLTKLDVDLLLVGSLHDGLTPWHAVYRTMRHVTCPNEFVLTNGGHITPMTAEIDDPRVSFWRNPDAGPTVAPEAWLESADETSGSWLKFYQPWLAKRSGKKRAAPKTLGNKAYPVLEQAPGSYVYS